MKKIICKCLGILLLVLLVVPAPSIANAAEEKTPAPSNVWINGGSIYWDPAEYKSDLKFRIYYKDKWSGESYSLVATRKGFDTENDSSLHSAFYFRDATNEENPQVIKEKKNGYTYYSLPAISGRKYKVAVKTYDEEYGLWSDITAAEYYFISTPEVSIEQTRKGVSLSWEPISGATKYYIDRVKLTRDYEEKSYRIVGGEQAGFIDKDVIKGEVYMYEVFAGRGRWISGTITSDFIRVNLPK